MATPERQLLLASFAAAPLPAAADGPTALVQQGDYAGALAASLRAVWAAAGTGTAPDSTPDWFEAAEGVFRRLLMGSPAAAEAAAVEQLLAAAVAALHLFVQANLSGPAASLPECPFDWIDEAAGAQWQQAAGGGADAAAAGEGGFGRDSTSAGDRWAGTQLAESGEDLVGLIRYPQYLLLARAALLAPLEVTPPAGDGGDGSDGGTAPAGAAATVAPARGAAWLTPERLPAWCWWAARAALLQQRLLSGRSAALRSLLGGLSQRVLAGLAAPVERGLAGLQAGGTASSGSSGAPGLEEQLLAAGALLECGLVEAAYGHMDAARQHLRRAGDVLGFTQELTGALGMRTVHQQEAKAQLLVAVTRAAGNPWTAAHAAGVLPGVAEPRAAIAAACSAQVELPDDLKGFTADSDVLPHARLVEGQGAATPSDLHPLEQALLLGWCLHTRKGSAADGLKPRELAAYVDAAARQERTHWLLHAAAALQASRLERERSRTRDRALLQLEQLAESLDGGCEALPPALRLRCAFCAWFPLRVLLRKELGEVLVGLGLVGSALPLFESLELWDNLIVCYQLLDKRVQAEELIRRRLEATPDEPRLWCALGDLSLDDAHYLQAWQRSGHRNARSQRSLARNALRNGQHAKAAQHWEAALALNPLHGEGWFSLGYCCIKEKEYGRALQAFTRSSQLEPENGEAWNNLAAIHMHLKHWRQAYNALSEAVKYKRDSWQTWENYAQVAVRVRQWQTAVRALQQVLVLSSGQRLDLAVAAALVAQVEAARGGGGGAAAEADAAEHEGPEAAAAAGSEPPAAAWQDASVAAEGAPPAEAGRDGGGAMAELAAALGDMSTGGAADDRAASLELAEAVQRAEVRSQAVLQQSVGNLLKQVAQTVSGDSAFWEVYARYQSATGYPEAAKECLLKRVRALGGSGWQASPEAFETYAHASAALCRAYLLAAEAGAGAVAQRELSSARLHLRSLVKQARERYEREAAFQEVEQLLAEVEARRA